MFNKKFIFQSLLQFRMNRVQYRNFSIGKLHMMKKICVNFFVSYKQWQKCNNYSWSWLIIVNEKLTSNVSNNIGNLLLACLKNVAVYKNVGWRTQEISWNIFNTPEFIINCLSNPELHDNLLQCHFIFLQLSDVLKKLFNFTWKIYIISQSLILRLSKFTHL